jgi:hypothetical protein
VSGLSSEATAAVVAMQTPEPAAAPDLLATALTHADRGWAVLTEGAPRLAQPSI